MGSAKCGWLAESRAARIPTSRVRQKTSVVDELRCELAGGAKVELNVAGPHAVQRQVDFGVRAGVLLDVHAAIGLALVGESSGRNAAHRVAMPFLAAHPGSIT